MKFLDYERLGLLSEALASKEVGDKVLMGRIEAYSCKPAGDDKRLMKELGSAYREEGLSLLQQGGVPLTAAVAGAGAGSQPASYHHPHFRIPTVSSEQQPQAAAPSPSLLLHGHSRTPPTGSGLRYGSVPTHLPSMMMMAAGGGGGAGGGYGGFSLSAAASSPLGDLTDPGTRKLLVQLIATMNSAFPDYDFSGVRPEQFLLVPDLRIVVADVHKHLFELCDVVSPTFLEELWSAVDEAVTLRECEVYSYVPDMEGDPFSDGNLWSFNYFFVNRRVKRIVFFTCIAKSKFQRMQEEREAAMEAAGGSGDSDGGGGGAGGGGASDYEDQYWVDDL